MRAPCFRVVVCEDDPLYRQTLRLALGPPFAVCGVGDAAALLQEVLQAPPDLVLLDLQLSTCAPTDKPYAEGLEALRQLRQACPQVPIWVHSGFCDATVVVQAMRLGASHYLPKNAGLAHLRSELTAHAEGLAAKAAQSAAAATVAAAPAAAMLGQSAAMQALRRQIASLRRFVGHVIVQGETGAGKELVARALAPAAAPFVAVDCATLAPGTADSLLFGHARGAFTGANQAHEGLLAAADGGVLYLDEIGNLHLEVQAKLLRALQEQEILPLGSTKTRQVNFTLLCATHADLQAEVDAGRFRHDLLARLQVFVLQVPPLRARREDVPLLLAHFLRRAWERAGGDIAQTPQPSAALLARLCAYHWPGNVRQLANLAVTLLAGAQGGPLDEGALLPGVLWGELPAAAAGTAMASMSPHAPSPTAAQPAPLSYRDSLRAHERQRLQVDYAQAGGSVSLLARRLGVDRSRLHRKLVDWGIHRPRAVAPPP